jgi:hypothetical protein
MADDFATWLSKQGGGSVGLAGQDAAAANRGLSGSASAEPGVHAAPMVYWGQATRGELMHDYNVGGQEKTLDDAMIDFYRWDDDERLAWGKRLYGAGLIDNAGDFDAQLKGWQRAVQGASDYYTNAGKKITPWKFMELYAKDSGLGPGGKKDLSGTTTRKDTNVFIPDRSDAEVAVKTLFKEQLGRAPEPGEMDRYVSMMLRKYRQNPETSTTTSTTDSEGRIVSQKSTTTGRFNPAGALENKAQADPEWGAYQAATTYYNALQSALGAPGGA